MQRENAQGEGTMTKTSSKPKEDDSLVQELARTYHEVGVAFERETGMSRSRLHLLASLRAGDELSQAELQQALGVDGAAITRQVKQLETDGLVARRADPEDHRFTLVALTAQGRKLADTVVRKRDAFEARLGSVVNAKDAAQMLKTFEKLREATQTKR
jgi:MarR family transcriptional regulator, transcriptional regulator for hemolysin